tara:strand:- start:378 stop:1673 length:1296 start_codon:yes stop_codon:yes gene_type:complete
MKTSYICLSAETLHHGHINLIKKANKYGEVIAGLLTDKAIVNNKRLPHLSFEQRKKLLENIKGIKKVVPQNHWSQEYNILKYKPDYFVHGDDWLTNGEIENKKRALVALKKYGGKLIEIPHTKGISSGAILRDQMKIATTPEIRKGMLSRLLKSKKLVRVIEVHSPISALVVENTKIKTKNEIKVFDCFWSSSLCDSIQMGKPDNEILDLSQRLDNINNIFEVSTKPLIIDLDTGGKIEHFSMNIKKLERLGISAVIIEDKTGLKKNSLFGNKANQTQDKISKFCEKIRMARKNIASDNFFIIARIESLILKKGMKDALNRAFSYVKAGANGIMIHSSLSTPAEVFKFAKLFRKKYSDIPLVCVPSTYSSVHEKLLEKNGFNIVIYANQITRTIYPQMIEVTKEILKNGRSFESEKKMLNISKIINLIPTP